MFDLYMDGLCFVLLVTLEFKFVRERKLGASKNDFYLRLKTTEDRHHSEHLRVFQPGNTKRGKKVNQNKV